MQPKLRSLWSCRIDPETDLYMQKTAIPDWSISAAINAAIQLKTGVDISGLKKHKYTPHFEKPFRVDCRNRTVYDTKADVAQAFCGRHNDIQKKRHMLRHAENAQKYGESIRRGRLGKPAALLPRLSTMAAIHRCFASTSATQMSAPNRSLISICR